MERRRTTYAAPARNHQFAHDGTDFSFDGFPRSSCERLYDLLTWTDTGPVLNEAGRPRRQQPPKHVDETCRFYYAQCMLYGLKVEKNTKPAVKERMLRALDMNDQHLTVPYSVQNLEKELSAEFEVADKAAKKRYKEDKIRSEIEFEEDKLKRKREDDEVLDEVFRLVAKRKKQSLDLKQETEPFDLDRIAGRYTIVAPHDDSLSTMRAKDGLSMTIASDDSHTQVHGEFDLCEYYGYLRSTSIDRRKHSITFLWRGRERGEGMSTGFGDEYTIRITFLDDDTFVGRATGPDMNCQIVGKYDVQGSRDADLDIAQWRCRYDGLNYANYELESRDRWRWR